MSTEINIKPRFNFKMLFCANLYLLINKPFAYIISAFYLLFFLSSTFLFFMGEQDFVFEIFSEVKKQPLFYIMFCLPFLFILLIYYSTKKQFNNNYRLKEDFVFIFNSEYFQEKGETFDLKHYWNKLLRVTERKSYFLIYHNRNRANVIPKDSFDNDKLLEFKTLLNSIDIKKKFKN